MRVDEVKRRRSCIWTVVVAAASAVVVVVVAVTETRSGIDGSSSGSRWIRNHFR